MRDLTGDGRGVVVTMTERGLNSYAVVRGERVVVVAAAADGHTAGLDAALHVPAAVEEARRCAGDGSGAGAA